MQFTCGPAASGGSWAEDGTPLFAGMPGRQGVGFEVMEGSGQTMARLAPVLLPADDESAEYERVVRQFATASMQLAEESVPLVLDVLARSADRDKRR
jgi:hypothetical protein